MHLLPSRKKKVGRQPTLSDRLVQKIGPSKEEETVTGRDQPSILQLDILKHRY